MTTKNILDKETGEVQIVELTAEEVATHETDQATFEQEIADRKAKIDEHNTLKASAKEKLIAGEALTEEEANTIVL
tara:strand:+ start:101 stop:328 length:228 start_codon:yes stop_codon:yes gene_type:complete